MVFRKLFKALIILIGSLINVFAQPDLVISALYFSSTKNLVAGADVVVNYKCHNIGVTPSISCYIDFYISDNKVLDPTDNKVAQRTINNLQDNTNTSNSALISMPSYLNVGEYYLIARIDSANVVFESNESNNIAISPLRIIKSVFDLVIINQHAGSIPVKPGQIIQLNWEEHNKGNGKLLSTTTSFYLSKDSLKDNFDVFLGDTTFSFSSNYQLNLNRKYTIPLGTEQGFYYILFISDADSTINEINERNNLCYFRITIENSEHELIMQGVSLPYNEVAQGTTVDVNASVINVGNYSESLVPVGIYLSDNNILDASDVLLGDTSYTVASNNTIPIMKKVMIPVSTPVGDYYLIYYADYTDILTEKNEANNFSSTQIKVVKSEIDLRMENCIINVNKGIPGSVLYSESYIINNGKNESPKDDIGYYLSEDMVFDGGDILLHFSEGTGLSSGSAEYRKDTLLIPDFISPGNYYILFVADYTDDILETNELNNVISVSYIIESSYTDLSASKYFVPAASFIGDTIKIYVSIFNGGNNSASFQVGLYLSVDSILDGEDIFICNTITETSLNAYSSDVIITDAVIPKSSVKGDYFIIIKADYQNTVLETDENNNLYYSKIYLGDVSLPSYNMLLTGNDTINSCEAIIYDNGGKDGMYSNNSGASFLIKPSITGRKARLRFTNIDVLYNDYIYVNNGVVTKVINNSYLSDYSLYGDNANGELNVQFISNSSGNGKGFSAIVTCVESIPIADLQIKHNTFQEDKVFVQGVTQDINYYILNSGASEASSSISKYYFSKDNKLDASDSLLGTINVKSIKSYMSETLYFIPVTIPKSVAPGKYYFIYQADATELVPELSESNNIGYNSVIVAEAFYDIGMTEMKLSRDNVTPGGYLKAENFGVLSSNINFLSSTVGYYLSGDTILDSEDVLLNNCSFYLSKTRIETCSRKFSIPDTVLPGIYYIISKADYLNEVDEKDESNNIAVKEINVVSRIIDVKIEYANLHNKNALYGSNRINTIYCIDANYDISFIHFDYYLSKDTVLDVGDSLILTSSEYVNLPTYVSNISRYLTIPTNVIAGKYYIIINVDSDDLISETNEVNNTYFIPFELDTAHTDISITSQNILWSSFIPGSQINISGTINVQGNITNVFSVMRVFISTDTIWSAEDIYMSGKNSNLDYASSRDYFNLNTTVPLGTIPGNYYILFIADYTAKVNETDENNNLVFCPITILEPTIDIELYNCNLLRQTVSVGDYEVINLLVVNNGTASVQNNYVGVYLSQDNTWDVSDQYITNVGINSFEYYTSFNASKSFSIPSTTISGDCYIVLRADYTDVLVESDETNNTVVIPIQLVAPFIDLAISIVTLANEIGAGSNKTINYYIGNSGNLLSPTSNSAILLSTDTIFDVTDILLSSVSETTIYARNQSYKTVSITIPFNTVSGEYYLLFYADINKQVTELNEMNNIFTYKLTISPPSCDLFITNQGSSLSVSSGSKVYLPSRINNAGPSYVSKSSIGYYLSKDAIFEPTDTYLGYIETDSLAAGKSLFYLKDVIIPINTEPGMYYLIYYADYAYKTVESNEVNNYSCGTIQILSPDIDLIITSLTCSDVLLGKTTSVSYTIKNIGTTTCPISIAGFFLSADTILNSEDHSLNTFMIQSINAGDSILKTSYLSFSSGVSVGNYYLFFVTNSNSGVIETNTDNNAVYLPIKIISSNLDLTVTDPVVPYPLKVGDIIDVSCTVKVLSSQSAGSAIVSFFLSKDSIYSENDYFMGGSAYHGEISGLMSREIKSNLHLPTEMETGIYYLLFYVDYDHYVYEADETNNVAFKKVYINPGTIDLYPHRIFVSPEGVEGDSIYVNCDIGNKGTALARNCEFGIYFSVDTIFDSSDTFLTELPTINLNGANMANKSADFILTGIASGNYYLICYADYKNKVDEIDETNNYIFEPFRVVLNWDFAIDNQKILSIQIYPNPAEDIVIIDLSQNTNDIIIDFIDLSGKIVKTIKYEKSMNYEMKVNIRELSKGIYTIKIHNQSMNIVRKLIKI